MPGISSQPARYWFSYYGDRDFLLSAYEASDHRRLCESRGDQFLSSREMFQCDLREGWLDHLRGQEVAYQDGLMVGNCSEPGRLSQFGPLYCGEGVEVFSVPTNPKDL